MIFSFIMVVPNWLRHVVLPCIVNVNVPNPLVSFQVRAARANERKSKGKGKGRVTPTPKPKVKAKKIAKAAVKKIAKAAVEKNMRMLFHPIALIHRETTPTRMGEAYLLATSKGGVRKYIVGASAKRTPKYLELAEELKALIDKGEITHFHQAKAWMIRSCDEAQPA